MRHPSSKKPPRFTPFKQVDYLVRNGEVVDAEPGEIVYKNSVYTVGRKLASVNEENPRQRCWELSIKRNDKGAIFDWRDFQRIKNEIVGPEAEGVVLFPAESRLVDTANQYWMYVFENQILPFGFKSRLVAEGPSLMGERQRPFEEDAKPADLITDKAKLAELYHQFVHGEYEDVVKLENDDALGTGSDSPGDDRSEPVPTAQATEGHNESV